MKKNRMMRLASGLMVAVLLTTSMISGTFAKYTTSVSSEDKARVAYWGFQSSNSINITDLFDDVYEIDDTSVDGITNSVDSKDDADVIAPGTEGSAKFAFAWDEKTSVQYKDAEEAGISVAGPEVAYNFEVKVEENCDNLIKVNTNIKWKLDEGEWGTWDEMVEAIEALSGDASGEKSYNPNELPTAFTSTDNVHTISWQWIFETADDASTAENNEMDFQDAKDTEMGNAAVLDDCSLKITITATQID